jgi:hypothetical protein
MSEQAAMYQEYGLSRQGREIPPEISSKHLYTPDAPKTFEMFGHGKTMGELGREGKLGTGVSTTGHTLYGGGTRDAGEVIAEIVATPGKLLGLELPAMPGLGTIAIIGGVLILGLIVFKVVL